MLLARQFALLQCAAKPAELTVAHITCVSNLAACPCSGGNLNPAVSWSLMLVHWSGVTPFVCLCMWSALVCACM
jgi:glycerol uptake facilitator-like aquaporin